MRAALLSFVLGVLLAGPSFSHSARAEHHSVAHKNALESLNPILSTSESQPPSKSACMTCEVECFEESVKKLASVEAGTLIFFRPIPRPFEWTQNLQGRTSDVFARLHSGLSPPLSI